MKAQLILVLGHHCFILSIQFLWSWKQEEMDNQHHTQLFYEPSLHVFLICSSFPIHTNVCLLTFQPPKKAKRINQEICEIYIYRGSENTPTQLPPLVGDIIQVSPYHHLDGYCWWPQQNLILGNWSNISCHTKPTGRVVEFLSTHLSW